MVSLQCSPFLQKVILGEIKYDAISNDTLATIIAPLLKHFSYDYVTTLIKNICARYNVSLNDINNISPNISTSSGEDESIHVESHQLKENECYKSG